jgi:general secretion pathway protein D
MTCNRWLVMLLVAGFAAGTLGGCNAAKSAFNSGQDQAKQGNWDAAVVYFTRAAREDPDNIEYRMALEQALREASKFHVQEARKFLASQDLEKAVEEFSLATQLDPSNQYAQQELIDARQALAERQERRQEASEFEERLQQARQLLTTQPVLEPSSQAPIYLRFAQDTSLQRIFEVLSTLSGINVLFDEAFRDRRVTINLVDVSFQEALDKLVLINRLFYKVVDPSTIIIVPDNAQKHRQYDDLVLRTFYVTNAEVNTVANMLRTIAGIQRVQPNPELQSITVRATPDQVAVAERILELNDKSKSEIILNIEILEVNRTKLLEFGLRASEYELGLNFAPAGSTSADGRTTFRLNRLASIDSSDWTVTFPSSIFYRFFKSNSEARLLASPKLRASEGQHATLMLGQ